jgi:hypothetical protein
VRVTLGEHCVDLRREPFLGACDAGVVEVLDHDAHAVARDCEVGMTVVVGDVLGDVVGKVLRLVVVAELELPPERVRFASPAARAGSTRPSSPSRRR